MRIIITLVLFLGLLSFAQETDVESQQKAVISALDSIEENVIGFALNGKAKGGVLGSVLKFKPENEEITNSEYLAYSDLLLSISVRPSNETKATFDLRFHKDWQSAYREGHNAPIVRWWSYDGNILDKSLKFNLGTMRVAYTPLTIYLPEPDLVMEPEIFSDLKKEAMEERYLDGSNRRLLQGLNLEYRISAGIIDNILLQGTIARLRKVADETDRTFFDFDPNRDRFSAAARIAVETFGVYFGVSDVYTFNRFSSSLKGNADSIAYEKNNVLSFELSYNSKKLLTGPLSFGAGAEYALSRWSSWLHEKQPKEQESTLNYVRLEEPSIPVIVGNNPNFYPQYRLGNVSGAAKYKLSKVDALENKDALLANAFVSFNQKPFEAKLSGNFLKTDKDFESELAATPAYLPKLQILNSDAIEQFRTGSLENMYYSLYYTLPLNAITMLSGPQANPESFTCGTKNGVPSISTPFSLYQIACLDNNYRLAHYYRNAYTQQTYTRKERAEFSYLDPSVNLALPNGYATPDRTGGDANLSFSWNKIVNIRGVLGKYNSDNAGTYNRAGGGIEVDIAQAANLSKALSISGSYERNKEEEGSNNPKTNRIMAGAKIGIWRGLSFAAGFQQLTSEFAKPYTLFSDPDAGDYLKINKTSEMLALGGPQIKISEAANFVLQGGLLSNTIFFNANGIKDNIDLDKFIVSGYVTVGF